MDVGDERWRASCLPEAAGHDLNLHGRITENPLKRLALHSRALPPQHRQIGEPSVQPGHPDIAARHVIDHVKSGIILRNCASQRLSSGCAAWVPHTSMTPSTFTPVSLLLADGIRTERKIAAMRHECLLPFATENEAQEFAQTCGDRRPWCAVDKSRNDACQGKALRNEVGVRGLIVRPLVPFAQRQRFYLAVGKANIRDRNTARILCQGIQYLRAAFVQRAVRPRDMRKFLDVPVPAMTATQHGFAKEQPEILIDLPTVGLDSPTAPLARQPELVPRTDVAWRALVLRTEDPLQLCHRQAQRDCSHAQKSCAHNRNS